MNLFRNIYPYYAAVLPEIDGNRLQDRLDAYRLRPCGRLEARTAGWASPYGDDERLFHEARGCFLLRYGTNERILPKPVVDAAVADRVAAYEDRMARRPNRREKLFMKDEVLMELLPQAFIKTTYVDCYLDTEENWLIIETSSSSKANEIASLIGRSNPDIKLVAIGREASVSHHLTRWISENHAPELFEISDECDLLEDDGSKVSFRRASADNMMEASTLVNAGHRVVRLRLSWAERLYFTLRHDFVFARIVPEDIVGEQLGDIAHEDEIAHLDAVFCYMTLEFRALLQSACAALQIRVSGEESRA